jgi:hypothetical protein
MLHMPTDDGGCVFIGPGGPPLTKRRASLSDFQSIVESFLRLLRPQDELLLHIEFTEHDGMGVAPEMICYSTERTVEAAIAGDTECCRRVWLSSVSGRGDAG